MPLRLLITSLLLASVCFQPVAAADAQIKPGIIVQETVNQVLEILGDEKMPEEEKKKSAYEIVGKQINFSGMSRRILAINWKKSSEAQRAEFEKLFREMLLNTYWQRIKNYDNEKVEYITGMIEGNRFATVDTVIVSDKIEIPITYRMELVGDKWMAYDFLIESLSLVTRYRTEYRATIKTDGIDGLLEQMRKKLDAK